WGGGDGGYRPGQWQEDPAERSDAVPRRDPQGLARRHVPAGSRPARTHSESRPPGEVSSPGNPDRERQGRAGRGEEHHGADLRGGFLSRLVRLPTGEVRPRSHRAPQGADALTRREALESG